MDNKENITISTTQQITYQKSETCYVITSRDWKRISDIVSHYKPYKGSWIKAFWTFIGILVSSILTFLTASNDFQYRDVVFCVIVFSIIICFIILIAHYGYKKQDRLYVDQLKEVLLDIEAAIVPQNKLSR